MRAFMDADYLLESETAKQLFHRYAENCPIVDCHNHLSTKDIARRAKMQNLSDLWLACDHYKWRAMRACGVDEAYITGSAPAYEKFMAWAGVVPKLIGSPLYHWVHLELQRYFNIYEPLNEDTAPAIWANTEKQLEHYDPATLLKAQKVKTICTTDDPADTLEWHERIKADASIEIKVLPGFRPDAYLEAARTGDYSLAARLGAKFGMEIANISDLECALSKALDHFASLGCKIADHGLSHFHYVRGTDNARLLLYLGKEYRQRSMAMQLHLGVLRNQSPRLFQSIGPDSGGDSVGLTVDPFMLGAYLGDLEEIGHLPNTVLYNLNPADNAVLSTLAASFAPNVQYGAAWWFSDTLRGIERQIDELMETSQLSQCVGMLTDSRSFSSFVRHEYYRRILCNRLGEQVERGMYPNDIERLGKLVEDICWRNTEAFFGI